MTETAEQSRRFQGIWFPKNIWLDSRLTAIEKIILLEIDSLDGDDGCYASNEYLANFCQCGQSTVSRAISKLKKLGYVESQSFDGRTRILHSNVLSGARQTPQIGKADSSNRQERILEETSSEEEVIINAPLPKKTRRKKSSFTPPSLDEVQAYVAEKGYHFDPQEFIDYYEADNWHQSNGKPVRSWRRCCQTWEKFWKDRNREKGESRGWDQYDQFF